MATTEDHRRVSEFRREMQRLNARDAKEAEKIKIKKTKKQPQEKGEDNVRAFVHRQTFVKDKGQLEKNFMEEMARINNRAEFNIDDHVRQFYEDDQYMRPVDVNGGYYDDIRGSDEDEDEDDEDVDELKNLICDQAGEISRLRKLIKSLRVELRELHLVLEETK